ncbi:MAG: AmmeMemoRadiSam system protein B [Desulfocapsa sp.]|nr:MAG: AmmeMemoRadiSam system protein B [Desulfocapsa sp.]
MKSSIRTPAVAGRFYPENEDFLRLTINELQPHSTPDRKKIFAAVSPHAGYVYSGGVAAETIAQIKVPETVILLGPNHTGKGAPIALSTATWEMVLGNIPVDQDIAQALLAETDYIKEDELAHRYEHSLEVQIPFLQMQQPNLSIVPLAISHVSFQVLEEIGRAIANVIKKSKKEVLILASSDMTHYEPRSEAEKKDHYVLKKLSNMDPKLLYSFVTDHRISMCGIMPVTVALISSIALGATQTELVRYTDSGAATGDTDQVVGYAGVLIT